MERARESGQRFIKVRHLSVKGEQAIRVTLDDPKCTCVALRARNISCLRTKSEISIYYKCFIDMAGSSSEEIDYALSSFFLF